MDPQLCATALPPTIAVMNVYEQKPIVDALFAIRSCLTFRSEVANLEYFRVLFGSFDPVRSTGLHTSCTCCNVHAFALCLFLLTQPSATSKLSQEMRAWWVPSVLTMPG
jgi:hypothetical protein